MLNCFIFVDIELANRRKYTAILDQHRDEPILLCAGYQHCQCHCEQLPRRPANVLSIRRLAEYGKTDSYQVTHGFYGQRYPTLDANRSGDYLFWIEYTFRYIAQGICNPLTH